MAAFLSNIAAPAARQTALQWSCNICQAKAGGFSCCNCKCFFYKCQTKLTVKNNLQIQNIPFLKIGGSAANVNKDDF